MQNNILRAMLQLLSCTLVPGVSYTTRRNNFPPSGNISLPLLPPKIKERREAKKHRGGREPRFEAKMATTCGIYCCNKKKKKVERKIVVQRRRKDVDNENDSDNSNENEDDSENDIENDNDTSIAKTI